MMPSRNISDSFLNQTPDAFKTPSQDEASTFPTDPPIISDLVSMQVCSTQLPSIAVPQAMAKARESSELSSKHIHDLTKTFQEMSVDKEDIRRWSVSPGVYTETTGNDTSRDLYSVSVDVSTHLLSGKTKRSRPVRLSKEMVLEYFTCYDIDGDSTLHMCVIKRMKALAWVLIHHCPHIEWLSLTNNRRQTPLHLAVITRQPDIARRLLCAGACAEARDMYGDTPLHIACARGYHDVVEQCLKPVSYEETLENNYEISFQRLPQDLTARNYEGLTCLHLAVLSRNVLLVKMLINAGADVNSREAKSGRTVLHLAAELDITELLLSLLYTRDVDVNSKTYAGQTAIQLALGRQHKETVRLLHEHGASHVQMDTVSSADINLLDIAMD